MVSLKFLAIAIKNLFLFLADIRLTKKSQFSLNNGQSLDFDYFMVEIQSYDISAYTKLNLNLILNSKFTRECY